MNESLRGERDSDDPYDSAIVDMYRAPTNFAHWLGIATEKVYTAIDELKIIGQECRFGTKVSIGYSPEQQEQIRQHLIENGDLVPIAPEGYLSMSALAKVLGCGNNREAFPAVKSAIEDLKIEGEVYKYAKRTGGRHAIHYSPEQQEQIKQYIDDDNNRDDASLE